MIVLWRITGRCNLACPFCSYDRSLPFARRDAMEETVRRFGSVLGTWRERSGERAHLSWLGGEPLLWSPLLALSCELRDRHGIEISATTNGTLLHRPDIQAGILDSFSELTVSVDGPEAFHDSLRRWPGGWRRLRASVSKLAGARTATGRPLKLRANIVLMHDNLPMLEELCEQLPDWGFDEITFNQLGGRDRPEYFPAHRLSPDDVAQLARLLPALRQRLMERGVRLCGSGRYLERILASAEDRTIDGGDCGPGRTFLFIDEDGRVAPCHFTADELGLPVEQIRSVEDIDDLHRHFSERRAQQRPAVCNDCPSTQVFAKFGS